MTNYLYFRGACLFCTGSGKTWYDRSCPYCYVGTAFHIASDKTIADYVMENMDSVNKERLLAYLSEEMKDMENENEL